MTAEGAAAPWTPLESQFFGEKVPRVFKKVPGWPLGCDRSTPGTAVKQTSPPYP